MSSKEEIQNQFDPNAPSVKGKIFGMPYTPEEAELVLIPVPWEATVSYRTGTAKAPEAILNASSQIDLYANDINEVWKIGIAMLPPSVDIFNENEKIRALAKKHIDALENGVLESDRDTLMVAKVNEACENLNIFVKNSCLRYLREGKLVGLVGGDHSTPMGLIRALAEKYDRFGILQIDAHADLRKAYEGFTYSHASIMYNALKLPAVARLVQVGIRDLCEEESAVINRSMGRVKTFFDADIKQNEFKGGQWHTICESIIKELPANVYISFDIDGLDPKLCPNTGTPVPGGLEFQQIAYLLKALAKSGKKIIGFDLNEVAPGNDDWDAIVGSRVLWELSKWCGVSNGLLKTS